jgi:hypothetical protein
MRVQAPRQDNGRRPPQLVTNSGTKLETGCLSRCRSKRRRMCRPPPRELSQVRAVQAHGSRRLRELCRVRRAGRRRTSNSRCAPSGGHHSASRFGSLVRFALRMSSGEDGRYVSTRGLRAARANVTKMLRNRKLPRARASSQLRTRGSLRRLNARVRLGVIFSGVLLGPY